MDPEHLELGFHVEMSPTQHASSFWGMLLVPAYRSWSVLFTSCAESCGAQKGSWTRRPCVPRTGGNGPLSRLLLQRPCLSIASCSMWLTGDGAGQERPGEGSREVSSCGPCISPAAALETCFLSYPFIGIFLELIGGSSQNIKEEAKPPPLYSPLLWGLWPPTPAHR